MTDVCGYQQDASHHQHGIRQNGPLNHIRRSDGHRWAVNQVARTDARDFADAHEINEMQTFFVSRGTTSQARRGISSDKQGEVHQPDQTPDLPPVYVIRSLWQTDLCPEDSARMAHLTGTRTKTLDSEAHGVFKSLQSNLVGIHLPCNAGVN